MSSNRHLTTDAIILKANKSGEINRIFTFISPTLGIKTATAFGAEKIKSRFCSSVQPFIQAKLFLYDNHKSSLYKLEDMSDLIMNDHLKHNLKMIYLSAFYSEILMDCYISAEEYRNYFYLLVYSLAILEEPQNLEKSFLFFTSKLFYLIGYNYSLNQCKACHSVYEQYFFDYKGGGIFCRNDTKSMNFPLDKNAAMLWKIFLANKYVEIKTINLDKKIFLQIYPIILMLIYEIFEKKLKTIDFIKDIFSL